MALALLLLDHFHRDTISLFSSKSPTQSCWFFSFLEKRSESSGLVSFYGVLVRSLLGKYLFASKDKFYGEARWFLTPLNVSVLPRAPVSLHHLKDHLSRNLYTLKSHESKRLPAICLFSSWGYPFCFLQSSLLNPYLPNHSSAGSQMASMISDILSNTGW